MEATTFGVVVTTIVVAASVTWVAKLLNTLWFHPRKLEKLLRQQGFIGNPYRLLLGDMKDYIKAVKEEQPRSIPLSDQIMPHVFAYEHRIISKYGPNSFYWLGPSPRLNITDPELIKDIVRRTGEFEKPSPETGKILTGGGILFQEGQKWVKRRKIVNHAFHLDKLKNMVPTMGLSCSHMIQKLKGAVANSSNRSRCEIDMWAYLKDLTGDVISRTAFGNSYEEAKRVFQLQNDRVELVLQLLHFSLKDIMD
ncbi:cytochrome P450 716A67-like [Salvia miltiorrhiza]|uniref:cytochrome P450 716A67-like n=1 Tax=Salvia miltiorrhiza TaxID=226208 RepID=UPI0025AD6D4C|nr:cytochrome P450 716A67-like [Salvia miltiorrhiza]